MGCLYCPPDYTVSRCRRPVACTASDPITNCFHGLCSVVGAGVGGIVSGLICLLTEGTEENISVDRDSCSLERRRQLFVLNCGHFLLQKQAMLVRQLEEELRMRMRNPSVELQQQMEMLFAENEHLTREIAILRETIKVGLCL